MRLSNSGITGSVNKCVRNEVKSHFRSNSTLRSARRPPLNQLLRFLLGRRQLAHFLLLYFSLTVAVLVAEIILSHFHNEHLPEWTLSEPPGPDIKGIIITTSGYLLAAQVGLLSIISIAIALVSILFDRGDSEKDVEMYYDESLAYEVFSSSFGLVLVLCFQIFWPLQFLIHKLGLGTPLQVFKLGLVGIHLIWFSVNVAAIAHYAATTLSFVRRAHRTQMRKNFLASEVLPAELTRRLRRAYYRSIGHLDNFPRLAGSKEANAYFGHSFGYNIENEIIIRRARSFNVHDVRTALLCIAVHSWLSRCDPAVGDTGSSLMSNRPILWFPMHIDQSYSGEQVLCSRQGGVPLNPFEKFLIRMSFRLGADR